MSTTPLPGPAAPWVREPVADLLGWLDPQYRVEGLNDDGEVSPDWAKVAAIAAKMRAGRFDYEAEPITMIASASGKMVFDGNHRVLAADSAGVETLPVWYTDRPLGG